MFLRVSETQGQTIKYLPKKLYPITTHRGWGVHDEEKKSVLENDSAASVQKYMGAFFLFPSLNDDREEKKKNTPSLLPSIQLSDYMGQYSVLQYDGCLLNSFTELGS